MSFLILQLCRNEGIQIGGTGLLPVHSQSPVYSFLVDGNGWKFDIQFGIGGNQPFLSLKPFPDSGVMNRNMPG